MAKVKIVFEMGDTVRDELVAAICWARNYQPTVQIQEEQVVTVNNIDGSTSEQTIMASVTVPNPIGPGQFAMSEFMKYGHDFIEKKRQHDAWQLSVIATKAQFEEEIVNNPNITVSAEEV
jgi:hypothetical protein